MLRHFMSDVYTLFFNNLEEAQRKFLVVLKQTYGCASIDVDV